MVLHPPLRSGKGVRELSVSLFQVRKHFCFHLGPPEMVNVPMDMNVPLNSEKGVQELSVSLFKVRDHFCFSLGAYSVLNPPLSSEKGVRELSVSLFQVRKHLGPPETVDVPMEMNVLDSEKGVPLSGIVTVSASV